MDPIREGVRRTENGESWTNWWLFPRMHSDEMVHDVIDWLGLDAYNGGPGRVFTRGAGVRHSRSYTLITQDGGYDV